MTFTQQAIESLLPFYSYSHVDLAVALGVIRLDKTNNFGQPKSQYWAWCNGTAEPRRQTVHVLEQLMLKHELVQVHRDVPVSAV